MEKAKISAYQLFALILLFEHGSAILLPLGLGAKRDVWVATLLGMLGGLVLMLVFYLLYKLYPGLLPTDYLQEIIGKWPGRVLALVYILYYTYMSKVVVRDAGEMLIDVGYSETPLLVLNLIMVLIVVYAVSRGIEVISRAGELFYVFLVIVILSFFVVILSSQMINISRILPMFEHGFTPVIKTVAAQTMYIPFGEAVVFATIFPYVKNSKQLPSRTFIALIISGVILTLINLINLGVLGLDLMVRSQFPLLSTIQTIELGGFLARFDFFFMLILIVGCFFKSTIFLYAAVTGFSTLFKIKDSAKLALPFGVIVLLLTMTIADNFIEHIYFGMVLLPIYVHLPLQVIVPILLLIIAFFRKSRKA